MSWDEGVDGATEDLNTLSRQQGGRRSKWIKDEKVKTRIELHPVLVFHSCLSVTHPPSLSVKVNTDI